MNLADTRNLILPVQIKTREWMGRLLIAYLAVQRGYSATIGDMLKMREFQGNIPVGMVIEKHLVPGFIGPIVSRAKSRGDLMAVSDEEGIYLDVESYLHSRLDTPSLDFSSGTFVWGERQRRDICNHIDDSYHHKIISTGSPRFDMARAELGPVHERTVSSIRKRFPGLILVNSSFAAMNSYLGKSDLPGFYKERGVIRSTTELEKVTDRVNFIRAVFPLFVDMVAKLSDKFPDRSIVIRPHPAEKPYLWDSLARQHKNVSVVHEGSSMHWIMASDVMIHSNCTTSLEAFALRKPSISYRPIKGDDRVEYPIFHISSAEASCLDELFDLVQKTAGIPVDHQNNREVFSEVKGWIKNIDGKLASQEILDHIDLIDYEKSAAPDAWRISLKPRALVKAGVLWYKGRFNPYYINKFPPTKESEVIETLGMFSHALGGHRPQVKAIAPNVFFLSS